MDDYFNTQIERRAKQSRAEQEVTMRQVINTYMWSRD